MQTVAHKPWIFELSTGSKATFVHNVETTQFPKFYPV